MSGLAFKAILSDFAPGEQSSEKGTERARSYTPAFFI